MGGKGKEQRERGAGKTREADQDALALSKVSTWSQRAHRTLWGGGEARAGHACEPIF